MIESLESRRLLATNIAITQTGGALDVVGGSDGSTVTVIEGYDTVAGHVKVVDGSNNNETTYTNVTSISITGQAKTDHIFYTGISIGAVINSGAGDDEIVINDNGEGAAAGHTYADGGGGDDDLIVIDSNRTTVLGGGGSDLLVLNSDVSQITSDSEIWAYGLGGSDVFDIYGGIIHHDATKNDLVVNL
jgi:hypothetical protein